MHYLIRLTAGSALLGAMALGAAETIQPYKHVVTSRAKVESTYSFSPQIKTGDWLTQHEVENVFQPNSLPKGVSNSLTAGGIGQSVGAVAMKGFFPSIDAHGYEPPDADFAVGPNHIISSCNVKLAFHTKAGVKQFEQLYSSFFSSFSPYGPFDPKCFYDAVSKRFFVVTLDVDFTNSKSRYLIAVSDDSDPNGNWFKYELDNMQDDGTNKYWLDYPGWGHNKDCIVTSGNMFGFSSGYNGIQFNVIRKAEMLTGAALVVTKFSAPGGSVQVMRGPDATSTSCYAVNFASTSALRVYAIQGGDTTTPTITTTDVPVPSFSQPADWCYSTGGVTLDPLDGRLMTVYYRNGRLYASHTIKAPSSNDNHSRWYEISMNNWPASGAPSFRQGGNIGLGSTVSTWMPAIAVNKDNDIVMAFSRTSTSQPPDFMLSFRRSVDPLGSMSAPQMWQASQSGTYGGFSSRWGDYFCAAVDPSDDTTFWSIGMIPAAGSGRWQTVIQSFAVGLPVTGSVQSVGVYEGTYVSGALADAVNSDNKYYSINSKSVLRTGHVASAQVTFKVPTGRKIYSLNTSIESRAVSRVSVNVYAWNWATSTYDYVGAGPLSTTDTTKTVNLPGTGAGYVSSTGQVKVIFRAINPTNTQYTGTAFTYKIDKVSINGVFGS